MAVAVVFIAGLLRVGSRFRVLNNLFQNASASAMHFACAALCTVIAYTAGFEGGAVAVVIIGAMVALIGAYLAMALADRAYPVFIAALNGYAACSVVAAGVGLANGALVVTGVALVLGCVAACTSAVPSRVSSKK
jgi:NAD/NADP transhydrogenase beta subunit